MKNFGTAQEYMRTSALLSGYTCFALDMPLELFKFRNRSSPWRNNLFPRHSEIAVVCGMLKVRYSVVAKKISSDNVHSSAEVMLQPCIWRIRLKTLLHWLL